MNLSRALLIQLCLACLLSAGAVSAQQSSSTSSAPVPKECGQKNVREYKKPEEIEGRVPYVAILDFKDSWMERSLRKRRINKKASHIHIDFPYITGVEQMSENTPLVFVVRNINPFKYDISLTSQRKDRFQGSQEVFVNNLVKITGVTQENSVFKDVAADGITGEGAITEQRLHIPPPIPGTLSLPAVLAKAPDFHKVAVALAGMANLDQLLKTEVENSEDFRIDLLRRSVLNKINVYFTTESNSLWEESEIDTTAAVRPDEVSLDTTSASKKSMEEVGASYNTIMQKLRKYQATLVHNLDARFGELAPNKNNLTAEDYQGIRDFYVGLKTNMAQIITRMQIASIFLRKILTASSKIAFGPVIIRGDSVHFSVKVTLASDSTKTVFEAKNIFTALPRNGWKIDFSPAIAFTKLIDRKYEVLTQDSKTGAPLFLDNTTTPAVILHSKPESNFNTAFAAQMNLYWKQPKWLVTPALTFGIGFRDGISAPVYMTGFSLLLGREKRITATLGLAFGSIQDITKVPTNQKFATSVLDTIAPAQAGQDRLEGLYNSPTRNALFFSLGFNF